MFTKILIANRGEIACRIARTARNLGIQTVAVYSDVDAGALHVAACDEAWPLDGTTAAESYLNAARILEICQQSGAEAVHPGYGFLSENAGFARALADHGVTFIGPPVEAIEAMGSKSAAKAIMARAGVPLVPGYHGEDQDEATLAREAEAIGYPVILKASAGGGGKGMRVVWEDRALSDALAAAKREAMAGFGDDHMLVEKYLTKPRHVEFQIFADRQGSVVHLFERDCSIQRRHQKVFEEAPAPGLEGALRETMGKAACEAARAIGYEGAGTVEFLLDEDGAFYFMEMNTRLQVEHPVTEMITGQDLVDWQLQVAAGQPLPLGQEALRITGHAIEARIYAEDPANDFLPATGTLGFLRPPLEQDGVRVDTGVREGDEVSIHYDPMIAKLIVRGDSRSEAVRRLVQALREYHVVGVTTNIGFLSQVASHPAFQAADLDTGFIARHEADLLPDRTTLPDEVLAVAALFELLRRDEAAQRQPDAGSPWNSTEGWRLNEPPWQAVLFFVQGEVVTVSAQATDKSGYKLELPGGTLQVSGRLESDGRLSAWLGTRQVSARVVALRHELTVLLDGQSWPVSLYDPIDAAVGGQGQGAGLRAPMPGKVIAVHVSQGDHVAAGEALVVVEAMKMEHTITADQAGVVAEVFFAPGDQVAEGMALLKLEEG